ncbi:MAG: DMT family transporter [Acidobacteria bacterium]|nr:DMT family transporter [Acidobacteriota bacterium]
MNDHKKAYVYALLAVFFWSTVASAFKISLRYLSILDLLLYSSLTSAVILFIFILKKRMLPELRASTKNDLLRSALLGALNPFVYYLILFKAYSLLPAQQAQPLNFTWAVILVLLSIPILGQRIGIISIVGVFISFAGVVVIATEGNPAALKFKEPLGVALALISSLFWALYWIYNTKDKRDPLIKLFLGFGFGFIFILITKLIAEGFALPSPAGLAGAIYVGIFEMGLTFVLWMNALKLAKTTAHVSILIFLAPFLSFIFINIFVGEKILISSILGLAFIVTGILVQKFDDRQ